MLNFLDEVILENVKLRNLSKLLKNINKNKTILELTEVDIDMGRFLIHKRNPVNFNIYLRK